MYKTIKQIINITVFSVFIILFSCRTESSVLVSSQFLDLSTKIKLSIFTQKSTLAETTIEEAKALIKTQAKYYNVHDKDSLVSKINDNAGKAKIEIHKEFYELLKTAIHYSRISSGAYDITYAALKPIWNIYDTNFKPPSNEEVNKCLKYVDYKKIYIEADKNKYYVKLLNPNTKIDLGNIAKGFIIDKISELFAKKGFSNYLVVIGGDLYASGTIDNDYWTIGIQNPRKTGKVLGDIKKIKNKAVTTSGDYERFVKYDDKIYSHIIDARTGYPADKAISATVIGNKAIDANALAMTLFVLGQEKGIDLVNSIDGYEAMIIDKEVKVFYSKQFKEISDFIEYDF